jgi:sialic acid synthase SpsE
MKIGTHDLSQKVLIIAEVGNNHEGNLSLAKEMIWAAKENGADIVKFQAFRTEHFISRHDKERFKKLKGFELTEDAFCSLASESSKAGITFLSTPFDIGSVNVLDPLVPAFKIASSDNTFYPLIEDIARRGKPILLSTGLADLSIIKKAQEMIEGIWKGMGVFPGLCLMHCVCHYPAESGELNLNAIPLLRSTFGCEVGYSDHSLGIEASVLAVAVGARVIEKHFTLNKKYSDFRDHKLAADPVEMRDMVKAIRSAETVLGTFEKKLQDSESQVVSFLRRYIAVVRDMSAGEKVTQQDITWLRGVGGFPAGKEYEVLGHSLKQAVLAGDFLRKDHF